MSLKRVVLPGLFGVLLSGGSALAASSPFGVGLMEQAPTGPLAFLLTWQSIFYQVMMAAFRPISEGSYSGSGLLIGASFIYGIFHAAGPGHGKAVISTYVLANRETLKRGVLLSFISALLQAVTAVALVSIGNFVLGLTALAMTDAARGFELAAYAMVVALGVYMVFGKVVRPLVMWRRHDPAFYDEVPACCDFHRLNGLGAELSPQVSPVPAGASRFRAEACAPQPPANPLRRAAVALISVGLRPCTGALFVLVLALNRKVFVAGILAVLAMSFGTALTVAALAFLAVSARSTAHKLSGRSSERLAVITRVLEGLAAIIVLVFGVAMFSWSLS